MTEAQRKVSNLAVFARMADSDDQELKFAPLSNIIEAQADKRGTKIVIGFGAHVVAQILRDELVGGLFLCDRKRFEEVKAEMEREVTR